MTVYGEPLPDDGASNDIWGAENNALWTAAPTFTERLQGMIVIASPVDSQAEFLVFNARFPFDIKQAAFQCFPSGTATLALKINSTDVGGLSASSATSTKQTANASSAFSVAATDSVTVTATSISGDVERIVYAIWGDRTDSGTAV